jgi:hypothetical protein
MKLVKDYFRELAQAVVGGWNRFWFTPADPATLGLIRILAGAMLFYTHAVWSLELTAFYGADAWISPQAADQVLGDGYTWSYFWWIQSPTLLWTVHLLALAVFAMLTLGIFSRVMAVLAYVIAVAYAQRVPGALFGLDKINCLLAMYLMLGPCGAAFSLDRWLAGRRARQAERTFPSAAVPSTGANIAIRLIQCHMCVIYLFAGMTKLQGVTWWNGTAMWGALANLEYQSIDVTWLAEWPMLIAAMTHLTIYWELSFIALVWPRLTRPLVLALAVPLHLGIALFMGMMTFGLVMLIGCVSFVPPELIRKLLGKSADKESPIPIRVAAKKPTRPVPGTRSAPHAG